MGKRSAKKSVKRTVKKIDVAHRLRKSMANRTKDQLIDALVELAKHNDKARRQLEARFEVEAPPDELVAATRHAIAQATDYDDRSINYNFDYDDAAYDEVKRNLAYLVSLGQLRRAMELSLELMKAGSRQVAMSDEGLMSDDIEECLEAVLKALRTSELPISEKLDWCEKMIHADRVGFICDEELKSLRSQFKAKKA